MAQIDHNAVRDRIVQVVRRKLGHPDKVGREVAFHMVDWLDDLEAYHRFCNDPQSGSDVDVSAMLENFLIHVPNHLAAASKLGIGIPVTDIFEVNATSEEE